MSKSMEESGSISIYKEKWPFKKKKNSASFMYRQKVINRNNEIKTLMNIKKKNVTFRCEQILDFFFYKRKLQL